MPRLSLSAWLKRLVRPTPPGRPWKARPRLEELEDRWLPTAYVVNSPLDTIAGDGLVTLREALTAISTQAASGDAPAGTPGANSISFNIAAGGVQTILVTGSALPTITASVAVQVTVDGTTQPGVSSGPGIVLDGLGAGPGANGLTLDANSSGSTIRGLCVQQFSGNGIAINGTSGNRIAGNYLGTDFSGTAALGNSADGVAIGGGASANTVGGTTAGARNVLSGNSIGVQIIDPGTSGNRVLGNFIGTDFTGTHALGNHNDGVLLHNGASHDTIGGTSAAAGNTIAFNRKGVVLVDRTTGGDGILGNRIFGNAGPGIDLGDNGPTPNGSNPRALPDGGQNFPVVTALSATTVSGSLQGTPRTSYRLEFFASPAGGPAFQGKVFLGFKLVSTNASGLAVFTARVAPIGRGQVVTATATNLKTGDTSEFSPGL